MKKRNPIFDNLRAICMLGVIAIHAGSFVMESATPSEHIFMLFEILSRYSVPTFFFISGYGLFYSYPLEKPLNYLPFLRKRLWSIGVPYVLMSLFYIYVSDLNYPNPHTWDIDSLLFKLSFGTAIYHIYFLVILMWFYICFPVWRTLMRLMEHISLQWSFGLLALLQIWLYKASAHFWGYPQWIMARDWLYNLCQYRLNYLPLFYLFVFMLGGAIARHYSLFQNFIAKHPRLIALCFIASASANGAIFYRYTYKWEMDLETTVNTLQQLSIPGLIYTLASIFFFSMLINKYPQVSSSLFHRISERSFLIYLIHPYIMDLLYFQLLWHGFPFKTIPMLPFYGAVVIISYVFSEVIHYIITKLKQAFN